MTKEVFFNVFCSWYCDKIEPSKPYDTEFVFKDIISNDKYCIGRNESIFENDKILASKSYYQYNIPITNAKNSQLYSFVFSCIEVSLKDENNDLGEFYKVDYEVIFDKTFPNNIQY